MPIVTSFIIKSLFYLEFNTQSMSTTGYATLVSPILSSAGLLAAGAPHFIHEIALDKTLANLFYEFAKPTIKYCSKVSLIEPLDPQSGDHRLPFQYSKTELFLSNFLSLRAVCLTSFMKLTSDFIRRVLLDKHSSTLEVVALPDCNQNWIFIKPEDETVLELYATILTYQQGKTINDNKNSTPIKPVNSKQIDNSPPPPPPLDDDDEEIFFDFNSFQKPAIKENLLQSCLVQIADAQLTARMILSFPLLIGSRKAKTSRTVFPVLCSYVACPLSFSSAAFCKHVTDFAVYALRNLIIGNIQLTFKDFSCLGIFEALRFSLNCFAADTQAQALYLLISVLGASFFHLKQNDSCCSTSVNNKKHFRMNAATVMRISDFLTPPTCHEVEDILKQAIDIAMSLETVEIQEKEEIESISRKRNGSKTAILRVLEVAPPLLMLLKVFLIFSPKINLKPLILNKWRLMETIIPWAVNFQITTENESHLASVAQEINEFGYELLSWVLYKTEHDDDLVRSHFCVSAQKIHDDDKEANKKKDQKKEAETPIVVSPSAQDKILDGLCRKSFDIFGGLYLPGNLFSCLIQLLGFDVSDGVDFCLTKVPTAATNRPIHPDCQNPNAPIREMMKRRFIASGCSSTPHHFSESLTNSFAIASRLIHEFDIIESILLNCVKFFGKIIVDRYIDHEGFLYTFSKEELLLFDNCVRLLSCLDIIEESFNGQKKLLLHTRNSHHLDSHKIEIGKLIKKVMSSDPEVARSIAAMIEGRVKQSYRGCVTV